MNGDGTSMGTVYMVVEFFGYGENIGEHKNVPSRMSRRGYGVHARGDVRYV